MVPLDPVLKGGACGARAGHEPFLTLKGDNDINTDALSEMLKRVQHDKKKSVIPNLFRNLDFGNDKKSIASVLVIHHVVFPKFQIQRS